MDFFSALRNVARIIACDTPGGERYFDAANSTRFHTFILRTGLRQYFPVVKLRFKDYSLRHSIQRFVLLCQIRWGLTDVREQSVRNIY